MNIPEKLFLPKEKLEQVVSMLSEFCAEVHSLDSQVDYEYHFCHGLKNLNKSLEELQKFAKMNEPKAHQKPSFLLTRGADYYPGVNKRLAILASEE